MIKFSHLMNIAMQGRSQDFSVGTHSFPSHLFTPHPPTPKKRSKSFSIHVSFISNRVRKSLNWIQINLFFCLLFLWVSMCERHCLSCESTTFCSSPFASIYVTYYKKQQCVHGFFSYKNENSLHRWPTKSHRFSKETDIGMWKNNFVVQVQK